MIDRFDSNDTPNPFSDIWKEHVGKYVKENNLGKSYYDTFFLTKSDNPHPTAENTGVVLARVLLTNLEDTVSDAHKYVFLQSFYMTGDLATMDVVKLPLGYHKNIVDKYVNEVLPHVLTLQHHPIKDGNGSRFLTVGGHTKVIDDKITFSGASADFKDQLFQYSSNDIAAYLINQSRGIVCGNDKQDLVKGEEYVTKVLDLMAHHKLSPDFFSKAADMYILESLKDKKFVGSHIYSALVMNKAYDRAEMENLDIFQCITDEMSEGLSREIILKVIAQKVANLKNN